MKKSTHKDTVVPAKGETVQEHVQELLCSVGAVKFIPTALSIIKGKEDGVVFENEPAYRTRRRGAYRLLGIWTLAAAVTVPAVGYLHDATTTTCEGETTTYLPQGGKLWDLARDVPGKPANRQDVVAAIMDLNGIRSEDVGILQPGELKVPEICD